MQGIRFDPKPSQDGEKRQKKKEKIEEKNLCSERDLKILHLTR